MAQQPDEKTAAVIGGDRCICCEAAAPERDVQRDFHRAMAMLSGSQETPRQASDGIRRSTKFNSSISRQRSQAQ